MKKFSQSPLPFQGQKRTFTKSFKTALANYPSKGVYVDLFGGSGLLSHTVKTVYPDAKVVYNDFDDFSKRLQAIPETNRMLVQFRQILSGYPRGVKITGKTREQIIKQLEEADRRGYVDWITLSSNLKFAMNYSINLSGFTGDMLYNKIRLSDYDATGYLGGVEIVRYDYRELFRQYRDVENVVFIVDPPYLSTDTATYGSNGYWKLRDYLDVLQVIHNQNYFYFTSNKSQIVELCEWISSVSATANPFAGATKNEVCTNTTYNTGYIDIMYHYKKKGQAE